MKGIRVLPPAYLVLAIAMMLALHFLLPGVRIIVFPWNFFGAIPLVLGIVINLLADRAFKKANTTVKPFEESTTLITNGIFRISRHPMYFGFVLILLGIALLIASMTPYIVVVLFAVFMDRVFIVVEERILEEKFGNTWLQYKSTVRRWI